MPANDPPFAVDRFSTDAIPAADRFDVWRERTLPSLGRVYETRPMEPFSTRLETVRFGAVTLSYSRMSAQFWERSPDIARADGLDMIMANIRFAGDGHGDADGVDFRAPVGGIVLSDMARPQRHVSDAAWSAVLSIPRSLARLWTPDPATLHGRVIAPEAAALLRSHLLETHRILGAIPASQAERLGRVALDLLEVALAGECASEPATGTAARESAERVIAARLGSATLTVANLCRWVGVSRSRLYRLFEPDGGVQAYVRARRLERVVAELAADGPRGRVNDIAERWGFCDAAYLTRVFRETYGMTPGEFRALAREGAVLPSAPAGSGPGSSS